MQATPAAAHTGTVVMCCFTVSSQQPDTHMALPKSARLKWRVCVSPLRAPLPFSLAGKTLDRDFYMDPKDAKDWGLIDHVIEHRPLETAVAS